MLLAPSASELQKMVLKMNDSIKKRGLKANASETKVMVFERGESTTECAILIEVKAGYGSRKMKVGSMLHSMCGVSQKDRCRNSDVRGRCGLKEDVVTAAIREHYLMRSAYEACNNFGNLNDKGTDDKIYDVFGAIKRKSKNGNPDSPRISYKLTNCHRPLPTHSPRLPLCPRLHAPNTPSTWIWITDHVVNHDPDPGSDLNSIPLKLP
ncbi:hypothetical protein EVAR_17209_1 [Eumeta japonica]|uniref:Uncharacterized protein n=1 Tax=Eumeta variegata TaxID=151549 RepID=A0A4C1U8Z2_EUMVA|nr:hypothetical protein EVAR_17209_1 [Eumeta japonica]